VPIMTATRGHQEDRLQFDDLYHSYYPGIVRYIFRRLPDGSKPEDAADVAAEVFTTAWRQFGHLPAPPEDKLWLYGVARRRLDRHRRSIWRRARLSSRLTAEATQVGPEDENHCERVRAALSRLEPLDREVIMLTTWDGLSHAEAAAVLGCTANAVGVRLHRARARLREQMTNMTPTDRIMPADGVSGVTKAT
jgi:RNA polymerase sigma factor (sigma-70 family)